MSDPRFQVIRPTNSSAPQNTEVKPELPLESRAVVVVNAGETLALLMHAARKDRAWIQDFAGETIQVSRDLYEVLLHYKRLAQADHARAA